MKKFNNVYKFTVERNEIRVCKAFFKATLSISNKLLQVILERITNEGRFSGSDGRLKFPPENKTLGVDKQNVKDHILSYRVMEPHYTRKNNNQKYLTVNLNIAKIYTHYI